MKVRELLHAMAGMGAVSNAANAVGMSAQQVGAITAGTYQGNILGQQMRSANKRLFHGNVEVLKVANGYIVNIGTKEGYEYVTHIAQTITEVNEIIAAQIVVFQLEDKT